MRTESFIEKFRLQSNLVVTIAVLKIPHLTELAV